MSPHLSKVTSSPRLTIWRLFSSGTDMLDVLIEAFNGHAVCLLERIAHLEGLIMADLSKLQVAVATQTTVIESVKTLIAGLSQQIKDAGTDQAALDAITAQLDANDAELTAAVTANTPVVDPTAPPVVA